MPSGVTVVRAVGVVLVVAFVLLVVLLWALQRRLIYLPDNSPAPPAGAVLPGAEDVWLTTSDGLDLRAWYVPPTAGDRAVTILVASGNGGNRAGRAPLAAALAAAGFATLLFDYRGYGGNPGHPSEAGLALDVRAAYRFLVQERNVSPSRLLYFGESLGGAVVTELAAEHPPAGMLLRSPFIDLESLARRLFFGLPVGPLVRDRFPVAATVGRIDVPTTVVYGTADDIVPAEHSAAVADAALGPVERVVLTGVGHNDAVMFGGADVVDAVVALAERAVASR